MHQLILTVGKWKAGLEKSLYQEYVRRSRWPVELRELNGFPALEVAHRQTRETELLLAHAKDAGAEHYIILDEIGKTLSSRTLAARLRQWQYSGTRRVAWLIGGDVGLDKTLFKPSDMLLSFGEMTWPHLLVRTMLAEQIYRAQTILSGHPYHRD